LLDFSFLAPRISGDAETLSGYFGKGVESVGAGRLESDQGADGFKQRGFSLGILTRENGAVRRCVQRERTEATEV
jgi:hypothetical protein